MTNNKNAETAKSIVEKFAFTDTNFGREIITAIESALTTAREDERQRVWGEAVKIAKDYGRDAGNRAFMIRDRYGDHGSNEADLEEAALVAAENIAKALTEAANEESQPLDAWDGFMESEEA